jgi:hypothetical protein
LALVVAARSGESSSGDDAVTVDDPSDTGVVASGGNGGGANEAAGSLVPGVDGAPDGLVGDAIRLVDFADIDQSGETCSEGLGGDAPGVIAVDQGESGVLDQDRLTRLEVEGAEAYGDLDGDGSDEALVRAVCAFGANGTQETLQVWDLDSGRPQAEASVAEPPASIDSRFPAQVSDVGIEEGRVVVTWASYGDDTPHCCPDEFTRFTYELIGNELLLIGTSESD